MAEDYDFLDPHLREDLREIERLAAENTRAKLRAVLPPPPSPTAPSEPFWSKVGRAGWRGLEAAGEMGHAAAQLPILGLKAPAALQEALTGKASPFLERVRQGARNVDREIGAGVKFFGEKAGTPLQEMKTDLPIVGEVSAATPFRALGTFIGPAPRVPAIPKLFSREAVKPALEGMAKMGALSGTIEAGHQLDTPEAERDWSKVPQSAAVGAALSPIFQRASALGTKPVTARAPGMEPPPGVSPIERRPDIATGPTQPRITDYTDVPYRDVPPTVPPQLPNRPVIQLPYREVPGTPDAFAKTRPSGMRQTDLLPESLDVNVQNRTPFLIKKPPQEYPLTQAKEQPSVSNLPRPIDIPKASVASQPRHTLPQEINDDLLQRVQFARDTMAVAGQERGFKNLIDTQGQGSTMDVVSGKSPTARWYQEVTNGPGKLSPQDVENALLKIEKDSGSDKGKYVERVKRALLNDPEYDQWRKSYGVRDPINESEAEFAFAPEEKEHPLELPNEVLPPLNDSGSGQGGGPWDLLKNAAQDERGSVSLGKDLGPLERYFVLPQHLAESHPEFEPFYHGLREREATASQLSHRWNTQMQPYFDLPEADRKILDAALLQRRYSGQGQNIPQQYHPATQAVDKTMGEIYDAMDSIRQAKGLPPMQREPFYVPLSRHGDIITVAENPPGHPAYVGASPTLREGEALEKYLHQQMPGAPTKVFESLSRKGEEGPLNFDTLTQLLKAGLMSPQEFEAAITKFGMPPGYAKHFMQSKRMLGASSDLLPVFNRYLDESANYASRFHYDPLISESIERMPKGRLQQYAQDLFNYTKEKPEEYARLRGSAAKFALGGNVGAALINKTQPMWMGLPILHRETGSLMKAHEALTWANRELEHPTPAAQAFLDLADKRGQLRPINAQELFGLSTVEPSGVEMGARRVQRMKEAGTISPGLASVLRKGTDTSANAADALYQGAQKLDIRTGKALGSDHPASMALFGNIEVKNRKLGILMGYKAGLDKGLQGKDLLNYAEKISEAINFNYSHMNRPPAWRGWRAPMGLFSVYPTGALTTQKRLLGDAVANAIHGNFSKIGPAATAAGLYWSLAGARGVPGLDWMNKTGVGPMQPGFLHDPTGGKPSDENWQDFAKDMAWYGPASTLAGLNVSSRTALFPQIPLDIEKGTIDPGSLAVTRPLVGAVSGARRFLNDPSGETLYKGLEEAAPPAVMAPMTAARWAYENGVGTRTDKPYLDESGKPAFYKPDFVEYAGKVLGFNPLGLQKARDRSEIQASTLNRYRQESAPMRHDVERHWEKNGIDTGHELARQYQRLHPSAYADTVKAYHAWVRNGKQGKIEQYYQLKQANAQTNRANKAKAAHEAEP